MTEAALIKVQGKDSNSNLDSSLYSLYDVGKKGLFFLIGGKDLDAKNRNEVDSVKTGSCTSYNIPPLAPAPVEPLSSI